MSECTGSCKIKKYKFDWDKVEIDTVTVDYKCGDKKNQSEVEGDKLTKEQKAAIPEGIIERAERDAKADKTHGLAKKVVRVKGNRFELVNASCGSGSCICVDSGGAAKTLAPLFKWFIISGLVKGAEPFGLKDCTLIDYKVSFAVLVTPEISDGVCMAQDEEEW